MFAVLVRDEILTANGSSLAFDFYVYRAGRPRVRLTDYSYEIYSRYANRYELRTRILLVLGSAIFGLGIVQGLFGAAGSGLLQLCGFSLGLWGLQRYFGDTPLSVSNAFSNKTDRAILMDANAGKIQVSGQIDPLELSYLRRMSAP